MWAGARCGLYELFWQPAVPLPLACFPIASPPSCDRHPLGGLQLGYPKMRCLSSHLGSTDIVPPCWRVQSPPSWRKLKINSNAVAKKYRYVKRKSSFLALWMARRFLGAKAFVKGSHTPWIQSSDLHLLYFLFNRGIPRRKMARLFPLTCYSLKPILVNQSVENNSEQMDWAGELPWVLGEGAFCPDALKAL